ncbi:VENN motif pre-toxin domain-containing protein [Seminibacterium arietis]|uniref:VENN motif pre-toxin domain-containing protein n=1 Tax=Seminibacterium arietis TaxID=1173502 RepID=A0ABW3I915_9PAST
MFITHTLYPNKKPNQLTEAEKKNITFLSQLAGGLASGLMGDSTQAVALGGNIAKRAVENNLLAQEDDEYVLESSELFNKNNSLNEKRKARTSELLIKSSYIDHLIKLYQEDPNKLNSVQRDYLHTELTKIAHSYNIPIENLYNWDFSKTIKRDDSKLSNYLAHNEYFWNRSYEGKQAKSFALGIVSGADGTVKFLGNTADYIIKTPVTQIGKDAIKVGEAVISLPKEFFAQDIPAHSIERQLLSMTSATGEDVGKAIWANVGGVATLSLGGKTVQWIGGVWRDICRARKSHQWD